MNAALRVERPGLLTTLQDFGRRGYRSLGISVGGAMDRFAFEAANRLVGNATGDAALEVTLIGPQLTALRDCLIALTGADLNPRLNGEPISMWTTLQLRENDKLGFGGRRKGARTYIAIAGGFSGDRWLGSMSTSLLVGRGGVNGRSLRIGDELSIAGLPSRPVALARQLTDDRRPKYLGPGVSVLHAIPGPQFDWLAPESRDVFFSQVYEVSPASDRMGYRLEGKPVAITGPELLSFGLAFGCVQMPWIGQPILLMADHQTAGGYPVVAGVTRADLTVAAQLVPGDRVRFKPTTLPEARRRWRKLMDLLETIDK